MKNLSAWPVQLSMILVSLVIILSVVFKIGCYIYDYATLSVGYYYVDPQDAEPDPFKEPNSLAKSCYRVVDIRGSYVKYIYNYPKNLSKYHTSSSTKTYFLGGSTTRVSEEDFKKLCPEIILYEELK